MFGPVGFDPYSPLAGSQIRLLSILPAETEGSVICSLQTVELEPSTKFIALSYVWGDTADTVPITVNSNPFHITRNLFEALVELAKWVHSPKFAAQHGCPLPLWIDGLCIDQTNLVEREAQVPRMGKIYRSATDVVAWLGPVRGLDPAMVEVVMNLGDFYAKRAGTEGYVEWVKSVPLAQLLGSISQYQNFLSAFGEILRRPWFKRVWILQEAVSRLDGPLMMIGPFLSRGLFAVFVALKTQTEGSQDLIGQVQLTHRGFIQIYILLRLAWNTTHVSATEPNALELFGERLSRIIRVATSLALAHPYECTVPHDMIYALFGMANIDPLLPPHLIPNYSKPFSEVYTAYTRFLMESTSELTVLEGYPLYLDPEISGIPSWVRDFRTPGVQASDAVILPATKATFTFSEDGQSLNLEGHRFGHIVAVFEPVLNEPIPQMVDRFNRTMLRPAATLQGCTLDDILAQQSDPTQTLGDAYVKISKEGWGRVAMAAVLARDTSFDPKLKLMRFALESNRIVLSSDGRVLLLMNYSLDVKVGDVFCVFRGSSFPTLLRPRGGPDGERFALLGICRDWFDQSDKARMFNERFFASRTRETFCLV